MENNKKQTPPLSGDTSSVCSDMAAGLRQMEESPSATKEELSKPIEERDKNKNEDIEIPSAPTFRSYDDIIENGSIYHKAILYINNFDMGRTFGSCSLTEEQVERIREQIYNTSEENRREGLIYIKTYNAFLQYGKLINIYKTTYQKEATKLTGLIGLWEASNNLYTALCNLLKAADIEPSQAEKFITLNNADSGNGYDIRFEGGKLILDNSKLWEKIVKQAETTADALSELKAFIEPLSNYIYSEGEPPLWPILPHRLERWMDYPDAIEEQRQPDKAKYFRFILRKRKKKGEAITPDEERLAVYPDYNEVPIDAETEEYAKGQLKDCFYLWEVEKRKKTPKRGRPKKNT